MWQAYRLPWMRPHLHHIKPSLQQDLCHLNRWFWLGGEILTKNCWQSIVHCRTKVENRHYAQVLPWHHLANVLKCWIRASFLLSPYLKPFVLAAQVLLESLPGPPQWLWHHCIPTYILVKKPPIALDHQINRSMFDKYIYLTNRCF